jgi:hypothetical protein
LLFNANMGNFSAISWREQVTFDVVVRFGLDQHA